MEANQLMRGDWIKTNDSSWLEKNRNKVCKVTFLGDDYIVGTEKASQKSLYGKGSGFEPIQLTSKILKKNGFHFGNTASEEDFCNSTGCSLPEEGWCYDEGAGEIKIIFPNESDGGLLRLDDQNADRHLELIFCNPLMVHQLQQALRLCGIDKEIVV